MPSPSDTPALRKARGAFFTPPPLARYVTNWAVRSTADRVLEPSCGEAAFLLAAVDRFNDLRASGHDSPAPRLHGVELHGASATAAGDLLHAADVEADIRVGDFFSFAPSGDFDAVIGNPPYVRYQEFTGTSRALSRESALRAGVPISNLASSWAAFTVHAALFLRRGGRLGLVLPAELLTVNYAAPVRRFLLERFRSVDLVMFEERVFPEVLEEVVLLLAEGYDEGPTDHFRVFQPRDADGLFGTPVVRSWKPVDLEAKWTPSLMPQPALQVFTDLSHGDGYTSMQSWGETTLGIVTGNNKYFALSPQRSADLGLRSADVVPLSPPGSRHLRDLTLSHKAITDLGATGAATLLFRPANTPSAAARRYIEAGEMAGVDQAYKCQIRPEWWRVPLIPPADLLLTYMNADTPRLCTNRAAVHHLNSVHGVYLNPRVRQLGMDYLPLASLNSMTVLAAETIGRAYGGGMLKVEPREADRLPMPSADVVDSVKSLLARIRPRVAQAVKAGRLAAAIALVDRVLLTDALGVSDADLSALRAAHAELSARRAARGKESRRG